MNTCTNSTVVQLSVYSYMYAGAGPAGTKKYTIGVIECPKLLGQGQTAICFRKYERNEGWVIIYEHKSIYFSSWNYFLDKDGISAWASAEFFTTRGKQKIKDIYVYILIILSHFKHISEHFVWNNVINIKNDNFSRACLYNRFSGRFRAWVRENFEIWR